MSAPVSHDYVERVREEIAGLSGDLSERGVSEDLAAVVRRLGLPEELALAALYRAARRSGISLRLLLTEITSQLDRAARPGA
jgi:hypothetical protein